MTTIGVWHQGLSFLFLIKTFDTYGYVASSFLSWFLFLVPYIFNKNKFVIQKDNKKITRRNKLYPDNVTYVDLVYSILCPVKLTC